MSADGATVAGLPELVARLQGAAAGIEDLTDANRAMVELVSRAADPNVPRRTGRLAASTQATATATGWGLTNGQPYALPVHWGTRTQRAQPWLWAAADRTTDQWTELLVDHIQQLLDG